jgi:hypothetical protein
VPIEQFYSRKAQKKNLNGREFFPRYLTHRPTINRIPPAFMQFGRKSMSLSHKADLYEGSIQETDRKHRDYEYRDATGAAAGFILALVCMALALVVASAIFTPAPVGSGIASEITTVGP